MHPRKVIRLAIVGALKAASTIAEDRIWAGDQPPVDVQQVLTDEGPVILVYTRHDRTARDGYSGDGQGKVKRECELCVEILAAGNFAVDDKLDDAAEQVEPIVDGFDVPGLPATEIRFREMHVETTAQFGKPVGGAFLIFDAEYWKDRQNYVVEPGMDCPTDVGVIVNGGPRIPLPVDCDCDHI